MYRHHWLILTVIVIAGCKPGEPSNIGTQKQSTLTPTKEPKQETPKQETPKKKETAPVVLTERAAKKVQTFQRETPEATYFRVSASDKRVSLDLDPNTDPTTDIKWETWGIVVVIDKASAAFLPTGIVVDYVGKLGEEKFKFCSPGSDQAPLESITLAEARRGFKTTLKTPAPKQAKTPVMKPPSDIFDLVRYDAQAGKLSAYLTPDPKDGKKHPAIIWITGGDCNSIDDGCWKGDGVLGNQSASEYRKSGIVMMFPSLRGGNDNPGSKEGFFGEVDDVLAAAAFLRNQPYVDSNRVYLGGHSTGGTMVLLTAECSDSFRAVFSFGPTDDVLGYGPEHSPFKNTDPNEYRLRLPVQWLHSIRSPLFMFEGASNGNADALLTMAGKSKNPKIKCFVINGADHFNLLSPTNRLIAEKIMKDTGPKCNLDFTQEEVNKPFVHKSN